ncbi:MAG: hypothetical protein K0R49_1843 [Burkholderiales bacterium]|jgi:hypothetical protein|nr:hypothetical protein [Burkholderiales bacterium]
MLKIFKIPMGTIDLEIWRIIDIRLILLSLVTYFFKVH